MQSLRNYQLEGVEKLIAFTSQRRAALLADEPGLGKTIQIARYIERTHPATVLVVCPASLRLNWLAELTKWSALYTLGFTSVEVESYEKATRRDPATMDMVDLIVYDEAHYMKNPDAKRTKVCIALPAKVRIFLTGTPIVNRPMDIYNILKACGSPMSRIDFGKEYCAGKLDRVPVSRDTYEALSRRGKARGIQKDRYGYFRMVWDFSGVSNADKLSALLRNHLMVRRLKRDVLTELPRKIRQIIELDVTVRDPQSAIAAAKVYASYTSAKENSASVKVDFEALALARIETSRAKLDHVVQFVNDLLEEEDKVVVFAYHRETVEALCSKLPAAVHLYGGMLDHAKDNAVRSFQHGTSRVFVGQITAAGTGITLTASKCVVFAEIDWVPANILQAEDRCHRMGQTDSVRVFHLVAKDSVDARMVHALVDKQQTIEGVLS